MASVMSAVSFTRSLVKGMSCGAFASQRQCYDKPFTSIIPGAKYKLWFVRTAFAKSAESAESSDFVLGKHNLVSFAIMGHCPNKTQYPYSTTNKLRKFEVQKRDLKLANTVPGPCSSWRRTSV